MTSEAATARRTLGPVVEQLAELDRMTVAQLGDKYRELYGKPTHSRNKAYLQKILAWRIQELAEGGLPARAVRRIAELGDELPEQWRRRMSADTPTKASAVPVASPPVAAATGKTLTRVYRGVTHQVTVLDDGFEYAGRRYTSLSRIAREITGTPWNGLVFFGLKSSRRGKTEPKP